MGQAIAIVGMACRYPDARSPGELWENALAERRAFRRIPAERLNLNDYLSSDRQSPIKHTRQKEPLSKVTSLTACASACRAGPIARPIRRTG